ncbi:hypothetical protein MPTK1_4g14760 [Marchantia polymorpha subsp. ruderalis]|uniref:Anaphase-promoting complex subunit 4 WD40 domain-containing protein n=2 Tax=Marchantia polymorpha TaxID=3197 RepID=A0AAF6B9Y9_MARPO|nr:hypothetical protein MARPO_0070s0005 [Marchantia polymorpha]BBN08823.1 hypothetical protein Mp_4g14760 [Marchantia polymorpha subsp. ruderalis]|eukprot:PTQ35529.1 hypothetical protein MARPO_0070s0005 [Marchantia polymorpha]
MAMKVCCCINDAHSMLVLCVAVNSARSEIYSGGRDCLIKVWDIESGKLLRKQQQHSNWITTLLFVPAPVKMLFSSSLDGNILVWSDRGRLLQVIEFGGPVFCLGWNPKRRQLVVGGRGAVQLYQVLRSSTTYLQTDSERKAVAYLKFLELSFCLCNHDDVVTSVCSTEKGKIFTVGLDRALCFFDGDRPDDTLRKIPNCHEGGITTVTYDKDSKWLVTGGYDGCVKIWSQEGHCLDCFDNITDCVTSIAYVFSTRCYWITGKNNSVVVIDPAAPADMTEWIQDTSSFHDYAIVQVLHDHTKDIVVGCTVDRRLVCWRYDRCVPHRVLHGHSTWVDVLLIAIRRAYKERLLIKDTTDIMPERKKLRKRKSIRNAGTPHSSMSGSSLSGASNTDTSGSSVRASTAATTSSSGASEIRMISYEPEIFSGSSDGQIIKWIPNPDPNKDIWVYSKIAPRCNRSINCMLHHVELDLLITGSGDSDISIWNMDGYRSVPLWRSATRKAHGPDILRGHTGKIVALCALPDLILVSASADKSLRFWDLSTRLPTDVYEMAQDHPFQDMTYSPTRDQLATCGGDSTVKIWFGERRKKVKHHLNAPVLDGDVEIVRWCTTHNGIWVTATERGCITTWDSLTQAALSTMCSHKQPVTAMLVDEENDYILISYLYDYSIRVYPLLLQGEEVCVYTGHTDQIHSIVYLKVRHQFISASWDTTLRVWLAPPYDKGPVAEKKMVLKDMLTSKAIEAPTEAPSDEFDITVEKSQYVSTYEKSHPIVIPEVLANPMNTDISALHMAVPKQDAVMAEVDKVICVSLCEKLDELEAQFKKQMIQDEEEKVKKKQKNPEVTFPNTAEMRIHPRADQK